MTTKLDAMIAPRALTARELAEVVAPNLAAYGVAHRAFTHAGVWTADDNAITHSAEAALESIKEEAVRSLGEWLSDCDQDGEPRFYRKASLVDAVKALAGAASLMFNSASPNEVEDYVRLLADRDGDTIRALMIAAVD